MILPNFPHPHLPTHTHTHALTYTLTYTHTHMHVCTHAHTHTHTHTGSPCSRLTVESDTHPLTISDKTGSSTGSLWVSQFVKMHVVRGFVR